MGSRVLHTQVYYTLRSAPSIHNSNQVSSAPAFGPYVRKVSSRSTSLTVIHAPFPVVAPRYEHVCRRILIGYRSLQNSAIFARAPSARTVSHAVGVSLDISCTFRRSSVFLPKRNVVGMLL